MKYLIPLCLLLTSCVPHSFELEQMSEDVIKLGKGVEIDIEPLPKQTIGRVLFR